MLKHARILAAAAATGLAIAAAAPAAAHTAPPTGPQVALDWNRTAIATLSASGKPGTESMIYLGLTQAAVYDAVTAIEGGFQPYRIRPGVPPQASPEAAAAAAAHGVLTEYFPAQAAALDVAYSASLAAIPDGPSEDRGALVGRQVAAGIVAARIGDGRDAPSPPVPIPAPGVWRPTPPALLAPQTPWVVAMTPLLLRRASQFQPGPPPQLGARRYARDLNETRLYGAKNGSLRRPEQTETALFYTENVVSMNNRALQAVVGRLSLDLEGAARALAMGNMVVADALTACLQAKYAYWFWRPVTAIALADTDGNPSTSADPTWEPLATTPNHPEYPAAHACNTAALGAVVAALEGRHRIDLVLDSTVTHTTHRFATLADLEREIVDARVWAGLHLRDSGEEGIRLGKRVAQWALQRYFGPARPRRDDD